MAIHLFIESPQSLDLILLVLAHNMLETCILQCLNKNCNVTQIRAPACMFESQQCMNGLYDKIKVQNNSILMRFIKYVSAFPVFFNVTFIYFSISAEDKTVTFDLI